MASGLFSFSRGTLMMDIMPVAMVILVPTLAFSIYEVRIKKNFQLHSRIQATLAGILMLAIVLFELDVRLNGWRQLATPSPYFDNWLFPVLYVHLFFSVSTTLLWAFMIAGVIRSRPEPLSANAQTRRHARMGKVTARLTYITAVTGCTFYWMAFVA